MNKRGLSVFLTFAVIAILIYFFGRKAVTIVTDRMTGDRWNKLLPEMQVKVLDLLDRAGKAGLDVMFFEGWRSVEDEQADIDKGTSKLKDPYNTHHLWGAAADIVFRNAAGFPSWPAASDPRWAQLEQIGNDALLNHPITWDKPHFELPDFNIASIRADYGTDYDQYLSDNGVTT